MQAECTGSPGLLKHAGMGSSSSDWSTFFVFFLILAAVHGLCFLMNESPAARDSWLLPSPCLPAGVSGDVMLPPRLLRSVKGASSSMLQFERTKQQLRQGYSI